MSAAIFYHPVTGMVTHFVVTDDVADGPNALLPHLNAATAAGLSVLQLPKLPAGQAVFDAVSQITGKPARLLDPVLAANPEPAARTAARATAFNAAILRGETYSQAMTAGQAAARAISGGPALA